MSDWRTAFRNRDWIAVENMWQWLELSEQRALLAALQEQVPKIIIENGTERYRRHVTVREASEEWKGAAKILQDGELEAWIEGNPPDAVSVWRDIRIEIEKDLRTLSTAPEVTRGAPELSRRRHAEEALEYLQNIDVSQSWMDQELDNEDDREWLNTVIAAAASDAFLAGRHAQIAVNKHIETAAVRGEKNAGGSKNGAHVTNKPRVLRTSKIIARMDQLIPLMSIDCAAAQSTAEGFGTSPEGNRQAWTRHKKKQRIAAQKTDS